MSEGVGLFSSSAGSVAVIALVFALLALAGGVALLARQQRLLGQYQQLMMGTSGGNLEAILNDHVGRVQHVAVQIDRVGERVARLEQASGVSLKHVSVVRYNPFHDTGGDQSFALALADDHGNGLVLSSLHARDVTRVYAKPLSLWGASYSLTDEEREAISQARQG